MPYIKKYLVLLGTRHLFFQEQQQHPQKYKKRKLTNQLNNSNKKQKLTPLKTDYESSCRYHFLKALRPSLAEHQLN